MKKATIMNRIRKAKQAGDTECEARLRDQLAQYQQERKARHGMRRTTYRVKRGDNYFSIAEDVYGDARYAIRLAKANKGLYQLSQGMVLQLPPRDEEEPLITDKEWADVLKSEGSETNASDTAKEPAPPAQVYNPEDTNAPPLRDNDEMNGNTTASDMPALVRLPKREQGSNAVSNHHLGTHNPDGLQYPVLDASDIDLESMEPEAISTWVREHPEQAWRKAYETAAYMVATGQVQLPQSSGTPRYSDQVQLASLDWPGGVGNAPEPTPAPGDEGEFRHDDNYYSIMLPPDFPFRNMRNYHGLSVANRIVNPEDTFKWDSTHIVFKNISGYNSYQDTKILKNERVIDIQGVDIPAIMVAAGISVQSWYLSPLWDKETWITVMKNAGDESGSGFGPAQVSNEQMRLYGLGGLDQTDPEVAKQAMAVRIAAALKTCENLDPIDKLIIAGMAQNGSFFDYDIFATAGNKKFVSKSNDMPGNVNWQKFFEKKYDLAPQEPLNAFLAREKDFNTQFMVKLYLQDMLELHKQGMELPYGVSAEEIDKTITYMEGIKITYVGEKEK